jgi:outer membrane biosynthesis protein TonB
MSWIKSLWAKWKVSISFVGGALVVASAYGTCTVEPDKEAIQKEVLEKAGIEEKKEESSEEKKEEPKVEEAKKEEPKEEPAAEEKAEEPKEEPK